MFQGFDPFVVLLQFHQGFLLRFFQEILLGFVHEFLQQFLLGFQQEILLEFIHDVVLELSGDHLLDSSPGISLGFSTKHPFLVPFTNRLAVYSWIQPPKDFFSALGILLKFLLGIFRELCKYFCFIWIGASRSRRGRGI